MEIILTFIFAFWLGSILKEVFMRVIFRDLLKDLGVSEQQLRDHARKRNISLPDEEESHTELPLVEIKIEQHQGQLYAFRLDNDQFLGQGSDRDTLIKRLASEAQNVKYLVRKDQGADLIRP